MTNVSKVYFGFSRALAAAGGAGALVDRSATAGVVGEQSVMSSIDLWFAQLVVVGLGPSRPAGVDRDRQPHGWPSASLSPVLQGRRSRISSWLRVKSSGTATIAVFSCRVTGSGATSQARWLGGSWSTRAVQAGKDRRPHGHRSSHYSRIPWCAASCPRGRRHLPHACPQAVNAAAACGNALPRRRGAAGGKRRSGPFCGTLLDDCRGLDFNPFAGKLTTRTLPSPEPCGKSFHRRVGGGTVPAAGSTLVWFALSTAAVAATWQGRDLTLARSRAYRLLGPGVEGAACPAPLAGAFRARHRGWAVPARLRPGAARRLVQYRPRPTVDPATCRRNVQAKPRRAPVTKRTFQPNNRRRHKTHGFRLRMRTRAGRAILASAGARAARAWPSGSAAGSVPCSLERTGSRRADLRRVARSGRRSGGAPLVVHACAPTTTPAPPSWASWSAGPSATPCSATGSSAGSGTCAETGSPCCRRAAPWSSGPSRPRPRATSAELAADLDRCLDGAWCARPVAAAMPGEPTEAVSGA